MSADPEQHRVERRGVLYDLIVPEGLALDALTVDRLVRRLASTDGAVAAVVAEPLAVPAGSSVRVQAERALAATGVVPALEPVSGPTCRAAGVARPGSGLVVTGSTIDTGGSAVMRDPQAVAASVAAQRPGLLEDASPAGRPLFTRRPVVLIAASSRSTVELAARWTDALIDLDVEPRLALPPTTSPAPGGRAPACALSEATAIALRPDVVILCDPDAAGQVEGFPWERYTVSIELADELDDRCELVSWKHGAARGRVRARVGPAVPPPTLAKLIGRLCGGPPPVLPAGIDQRLGKSWSGSASGPTAPRRRAAGPVRTVAIVGEPATEADRRRWAGVAEQFALLGCSVDDDQRSPGPGHDLVLVGGSVSSAERRVIAERVEQRLHTAVLVGHDQVTLDGERPALVDGARELAEQVGLALVPSRSLARPTEPRGWRARHLPTAVGWQRTAQLQAAGTSRPAGGEPVVAWIADVVAPDDPVEAELQAWLRSDESASVVVVPGPGVLPPLPEHPRASVAASLDAVDAAGWSGVVWSPRPERLVSGGDDLVAVELALAGVPFYADGQVARSLGGLGELVRPVDRAVLGLGSIEARNRGRALHDRAASLHGARSAAVSAHRVLGWLLREHT